MRRTWVGSQVSIYRDRLTGVNALDTGLLVDFDGIGVQQSSFAMDDWNVVTLVERLSHRCLFGDNRLAWRRLRHRGQCRSLRRRIVVL